MVRIFVSFKGDLQKRKENVNPNSPSWLNLRTDGRRLFLRRGLDVPHNRKKDERGC